MATVNSIFFDAVLAAASPDTVAMPNVEFNPEQLEKYYEVYVLPGNVTPFDLCGHYVQPGICQISCFVKEKVGEIKAVEMAQKIVAAFPQNTRFKDDAFQINTSSNAYYSKGANTKNGWYVVPVTIPYTVHNF